MLSFLLSSELFYFGLMLQFEDGDLNGDRDGKTNFQKLRLKNS
jgi:hypothetical protein